MRARETPRPSVSDTSGVETPEAETLFGTDESVPGQKPIVRRLLIRTVCLPVAAATATTAIAAAASTTAAPTASTAAAPTAAAKSAAPSATTSAAPARAAAIARRTRFVHNDATSLELLAV